MCELLGLCFNVPVDLEISLGAFRRRGERNPDGWGVALYPDRAALVVKEPLRSTESELFDLLLRRVRTRILIAHVRRASVGSVAYKNTHPFPRELNGREYVFAHNGTVDSEGLELGRFRPVGDTDSERVFCHLLAEIERRGVVGWGRDDFEWLHRRLLELNELGTLNCLMSDGEHLFAYHDAGGYNGLCYVRRAAPFPRVRLVDEDFEVDLGELKKPEERGYVVATRPLTDEGWESFEPGELIVFRGGEIVYRGRPRPSV